MVQLRPYQQAMVDGVIAYLSEHADEEWLHRNVLVVAQTGAGKTPTLAHMVGLGTIVSVNVVDLRYS